MGNCGGKKEGPTRQEQELKKNAEALKEREELKENPPPPDVDFTGAKVDVHLLNAFIREGVEEGKDTGNPAGVVMLKQVDGFDLTMLKEDNLLHIAKEVGLSETAFCKFRPEGDVEISFFTPTKQVNLCAHATVAAWSHMFADGIISSGAHAMNTKAGMQAINVWKNGTIRMTQEITKLKKISSKTVLKLQN